MYYHIVENLIGNIHVCRISIIALRLQLSQLHQFDGRLQLIIKWLHLRHYGHSFYDFGLCTHACRSCFTYPIGRDNKQLQLRHGE